jgi:hypothetical protein
MADLLHRRAEANNELPIRELMWGHAWINGGRNLHGRDDTGTEMAGAIPGAGGPTVG